MYADLNTPERILLGPGPSMVHPRVLRAMAHPLLGHLDPQFIALMNEVQDLLRYVFQTENQMTLPVSGTGSASMESTVANLLEPGDSILIGVNGYFGERLCDMAGRYGAEVRRLERPWGDVFDPDEIDAALRQKPAKVVALVHAETSTGVLQPMAEIIRLAKEHDVMILLDAVTSLGGVELKADEWGLDAVYSCSQKCIGAPSGLAPVTFSERAIKAAKSRKHPIRSWYLDITLLDQYWGSSKVYHHTSSSTLNYALLEALRLIEEEGLQNRFERHLRNHRALVAGVEAMGLKMLVKPEHRLPTLNTIRVPDGVDEAKVRGYLLQTLNLEIGAGLGALKGQVWRVGLMGYSSSAENVLFFLSAMSRALAVQGCKTDLSAGLEAAMSLLNA